MKSLLGVLCLNRPKIFKVCIHLLLKSTQRNDLTIIIVDNGSNEETQEVIRSIEKDVDMIIRHEWNTGYAFGVNSWMSLRDEKQHCIQIDQDMLMCSPEWWELMQVILQDEDIGMLAARRPTAWIDRQEKWDAYTESGFMKFERRHGLWLEIPANNCLIAPILIYKGTVLDQIGFENEATGWGDLESYHRIAALGLKSAYVPEIFLYQEQDTLESQHPNRGAHEELLIKRKALNEKYTEHYGRKEKLYCGTRFLPLTMIDEEYKRYSDENWEFYENWKPK